MEIISIRHDDVSNLNTEASNQQNSFEDTNIEVESITDAAVSKLWSSFDACMNSHKFRYFVFILLICLSMTAGILVICLTTPKSSETCKRDFQRTMKSSVVYDSQPTFVVLDDINKDQQIDIVLSHYGTDSIGIFISKGNGTFEDQQTYPTGQGSKPYSVVIYDFNKDTHADIAVANYGTNNIGIFINKRNGTFYDQRILSLNSSRPVFLSIGDFNEDNQMDLVVVNYGTNNIGILLSYGNGSFQSQITYSTGYDSFPASLVVADFNNDTHLDIVVTNSGTDNIGIFIGYGNGTFTNQQTFTTLSNSNSSSIAVGDFNNDYKLDVVVANYGTSNIGIFFGYGNGSFEKLITYSIGSKSYPEYVTVGDMNNDNQLDIIVVDSQNNQIHILPGDRNGSYTLLTTYDGVDDSQPLCVAVTDLNKNNQSDIVVVNYGTDNTLVLIDYSIQQSARQTNYIPSTSSNLAKVAVGDLNSDRIIDIVYATTNYLHIRFGVGDGTFGADKTFRISSLRRPQHICVGDLNNDTKTDIVIIDLSSYAVFVLLGNSNGTSFSLETYDTGDGSNPYWVVLGDVNNDDRVDIVLVNQGTNTVGIFLGNGDGTFNTMVPYFISIGYIPYSVALGDLNRDNYVDLAVTHGNGHIVIFAGYGNGSFIIWKILYTDQNSISLAIDLHDLNNDNYLDIVVTNMLDNSIGIFLGYENATFRTQTKYFTGTGSQPYVVVVTDFNNDNIPDIAASNLGSDEIIIFHGVGNGIFKFHMKHSTGIGSKPYGIAAADFNNDTQLDIVVALFGNNYIATLIEYKAAVFATEIKYSTGSTPQPYSFALGDFNNDNRTDIVVANSATDNLSIMLAFDNGTYDMMTKYKIGTDYYPQYVITCDINNDGHLDVVVVNSKVNSISVIIGYGNGTFAEQIIYLTGTDSYPVAVASGDINNDKRLDLIVANERTDTINIFRGFNYTVFESQKTYSNNDSLNPYDIVVYDFNNDNHLDIATTFYDSDKIGIFLGDGNGSFTTIITYSTGNNSGPYGIAVNDLNNDGRLDIVVTMHIIDTIGIFRGYGNGSFTLIMTYSTGKGSGPIAVTIRDVNHDNQLDIVVVNSNSNSIGILIGDSNGNFLDVIIYSTGDDSSPKSVTLADFNHNNNLDIAVANSGTHNIGILVGYGDGTFEEQFTLPMTTSSRPMSIVTGDFNSDNELDIAVADWNNCKISIFNGYGDGTFDTMRTYSSGDGSLPRDISVYDFNNDNISDIAVVNSGTNSIVVLFGMGDGSFLLGKAHTTGTSSSPYALAIGDFNNDARVDIAVVNNNANNTGVFLAYGSEYFASQTIINLQAGSNPYAIIVYDLDYDDYLDIVVVNYGSNSLGILLGYGDGTFNNLMKYTTGNDSGPSSIALGYFNDDTYVDIVVVNSQINSIILYLGVGYGDFEIGNSYSTGTGSYPYAVTTGDFNNDNITDIAVTNYGTNSIMLLYGYGDGVFGNQSLYPLGYNYNPDFIAVKDLNNDNLLDIIVACHDTDHVESFIKMCPYIY